MSQPSSHAVSLGPDAGRWKPESYADVVEAAAGGLLDESHWVELKREVPPSNAGANTELARDLASLAPDGGVLIVGVKDKPREADAVVGVELAKLADRVDAVARNAVQPPLAVRSRELHDPDRPGYGCLLVQVPASPQAPHMVDRHYWGRGDRGKDKLRDDQVRAMFESRSLGHIDLIEAMRVLAAEDPLDADVRRNGHLYVVAHPVTRTPRRSPRCWRTARVPADSSRS
jgi:hypothetical protein